MPGGRSGVGGADGGGATTSAALTTALRSDAGSYRWVAATFGSQSAATLELASDEPVMAIGGFNGEGGNISLATFEAYVAKGEIHYFISSGAGGGGAPGGGGGRNSDAAITSWVEAHFTTDSGRRPERSTTSHRPETVESGRPQPSIQRRGSVPRARHRHPADEVLRGVPGRHHHQPGHAGRPRRPGRASRHLVEHHRHRCRAPCPRSSSIGDGCGASTGRRSLFGQIVPFCALSFTGLVVSTLAVGMVAGRTAGWSHWSHTVAVLSANVAAYGRLWVVQYQMLDRILFRTAGRDRAQVVNLAGPAPTARSRWEPEELPGDRTLPGRSSGSTTLKR